MKYALLPLILSLCACATSHPSAPACLQVRQWSIVEQQNMKADLETLPKDSPVLPAFSDYARMRAEARACNGE